MIKNVERMQAVIEKADAIVALYKSRCDLAELAQPVVEYKEARAKLEPQPDCTCPPVFDGPSFSTYGPCTDSLYHLTTCLVARREMAKATWPCGARKYPNVQP